MLVKGLEKWPRGYENEGLIPSAHMAANNCLTPLRVSDARRSALLFTGAGTPMAHRQTLVNAKRNVHPTGVLDLTSSSLLNGFSEPYPESGTIGFHIVLEYE